jgi:hypothetical protein
MADEKERLLARKKDIENRLAEIEKAEQNKREKQEKRRAELAGRAVLKHARKDEAFGRQLRAILDSEIAGARLRALFDLPVKPATAPAPKQPSQATG